MPFFSTVQSSLSYLYILYCTQIDCAVKYYNSCFVFSRMFTLQSVPYAKLWIEHT
jgi:hypothetical protein